MTPDDLVERVAMILMGRFMVSQEDAAHIWHGMYEPEKEQFRREARAAIAVALEEAAKVTEEKLASMPALTQSLYDVGYNVALYDTAAAIHAMIPKESE